MFAPDAFVHISSIWKEKATPKDAKPHAKPHAKLRGSSDNHLIATNQPLSSATTQPRLVKPKATLLQRQPQPRPQAQPPPPRPPPPAFTLVSKHDERVDVHMAIVTRRAVWVDGPCMGASLCVRCFASMRAVLRISSMRAVRAGEKLRTEVRC